MVSWRSTIFLALGLPALRLVRGTQYNLIKQYAGANFFDDWDFYGNCELRLCLALKVTDIHMSTVDNLTHGNAKYVRVQRGRVPYPSLF